MSRRLAFLAVLVVAVGALVVALAEGATLPGLGDGLEGHAVPAATPRASEAALEYVVLGDSIGTGAGASTSYVSGVSQHLEGEAGGPVAVRNLARNGWTSGELLVALQTDPLFRRRVTAADVVSYSVGGNDLLAAGLHVVAGTCGGVDGLDCVRSAVSELEATIDGINAELVELAPDATVVAVDLYDPFARAGVLGAAQADPAQLQTYLDAANSHIASSAADHGLRVAMISESFNGPSGNGDATEAGLIADDGLHPSDAGHDRIAAAVVAALSM